MKSLSVKIVLALALLIGFTCGTVHAQGVDFSIWDGSLWKIKQTGKGSYFADENALTSSAKIRGTDQVWGVMAADATGENISIDTYEIINGECQPMDTIPLVYQAGGPLEFYATFVIDEADVVYATGLFAFTAKLKNDALQKGKMTTLGAYALEQDFDENVGSLAVFGLNISGTTVLEKAFKCPIP